MRRSLIEPIFETELEPGQAAEHALKTVHPFNKDVALPQVLLDNIAAVCSDPAAVNDKRHELLKLWKARAEELQPGSLAELDKVSDPFLRRLLRGVPDGVAPKLGQFFHVQLWREMAAAGNCKDQHLIEELLVGMNIVGDVAKSGRWPPLEIDKRC